MSGFTVRTKSESTGFQLVGEGQQTWIAPHRTGTKVFHNQADYIAYMKHRHASMKGSRLGRQQHTEAAIISRGFNPNDQVFTEGSRNFIPDAVEDIVGNPHFMELKTRGYYSKTFSDNIYPAAIKAGRQGTPFTLILEGDASISKPLWRHLRWHQKRFGGDIPPPPR
ncbi:hypothetical protein ACFL27_02745 [candidate division CSSED10-310 bacterium]|uniref:VRR-NUC domain-containing protein n=1 Tax=candidate division CSSED10-310 bacterium TaxID=2855610 RepID=A0ABV6YSF7_UNCC1